MECLTIKLKYKEFSSENERIKEMTNTVIAKSFLFEILSGRNELINPGSFDYKGITKLKNFKDLMDDVEYSIQKYRGKYNQLFQEKNDPNCELNDRDYLNRLDDIKWRFRMSIYILGTFNENVIDELFSKYIMLEKGDNND